MFEDLSETNIYDLPGLDLGVISNSKCVQAADNVRRRQPRFTFPKLLTKLHVKHYHVIQLDSFM